MQYRVHVHTRSFFVSSCPSSIPALVLPFHLFVLPTSACKPPWTQWPATISLSFLSLLCRGSQLLSTLPSSPAFAPFFISAAFTHLRVTGNCGLLFLLAFLSSLCLSSPLRCTHSPNKPKTQRRRSREFLAAVEIFLFAISLDARKGRKFLSTTIPAYRGKLD